MTFFTLFFIKVIKGVVLIHYRMKRTCHLLANVMHNDASGYSHQLEKNLLWGWGSPNPTIDSGLRSASAQCSLPAVLLPSRHIIVCILKFGLDMEPLN